MNKNFLFLLPFMTSVVLFLSYFIISNNFTQCWNQICRSVGGTLHVHGNVKDSEEEQWSQHLLHSITEIAKSEGFFFSFFHFFPSWDIYRLSFDLVLIWLIFYFRSLLGYLDKTCWESKMVRPSHSPSCCRCSMHKDSTEQLRNLLPGWIEMSSWWWWCIYSKPQSGTSLDRLDMTLKGGI